jgi:hypothetical protein
MAEIFKRRREESRKNYGSNREENVGLISTEVQVGAILRIADATEKMAENHSDLIRDRDYYERRWMESQKVCERLRHQIAGLKGYIKRMKK